MRPGAFDPGPGVAPAVGRTGGWMAAAIGLIAGSASGLLGVGGGFLVVPLLTLWARLDPRRASGTSLAAILPIAALGAAGYYLGAATPQVNLPVAGLLVIGSVLGAYLGARFIAHVPRHALLVLLALILVAVALDELVRALVPRSAGLSPSGAAMPIDLFHGGLVVFAGLVIGVLSGLTGVGGGVFLVPVMVLGFGLTQHVAQGTSLVAILPTAAVGAVTHLRHGNVDLRAALWIGAAGLPAVLAGTAAALALPQRVLAGLFGLLLLVAAYRMWPRHPGPE